MPQFLWLHKMWKGTAIRVTDRLIRRGILGSATWCAILTAAELSSTVKRKPDKMSAFTPSNKAFLLVFTKKKKVQKILNNTKCPSFHTVKIFQCCQSDFRASRVRLLQAERRVAPQALVMYPSLMRKS